MAEFWFHSTIDEWWGLLDAVLQQHAVRFAVDQPHTDPWATEYPALTDQLKTAILSSTRSIFLLGDAYSNAPPYLRRQPEGTLAGKYFIDISRGGPVMDMSMPGQFDEGGLTWFGEGRLTFQKLYWNDSLTQAYPAPKALTDEFGAIKRTLQRQLLAKAIEKKKMWISPDAWALFESGKAAFAVDGRCYTVHGQVPPPTPWRYTPIKTEQA